MLKLKMDNLIVHYIKTNHEIETIDFIQCNREIGN
jgi:hypothetical protein